MKIGAKEGRPYIVPTLYGLAYFFLILNIFALGYYRSSAPFHTVGLTLSILGLVAMIQANGSARGIACGPPSISPAAAGDRTRLTLRLSSEEPLGHFNLEAEAERPWAEGGQTIDYMKQSCDLSLPLRSRKRGIYIIRSIKIGSRGLFGLFYSWASLPIEAEWIVYPRPHGCLPLPPSVEGASGRALQGEDFQGHLPHLPGTPLRQIDWKAFARSEKLLVKSFQEQDEGGLRLSLDLLHPMDIEAQLEQLSAWVFLCFEENRAFSLELGERMLAEGFGAKHFEAALRELAAYGGVP